MYMLQELIQNAEDAGATEVKFLYDCNTYGQDKRYLHCPELSQFQVKMFSERGKAYRYFTIV